MITADYFNVNVDVDIIRRTVSLVYKNGKDILPEELLRELQRHIQGEIIYIPKLDERKGWGEGNGTRSAISDRNKEIYYKYKHGFTIVQLTDLYNLCEDSIKKIIYKMNRQIGGLE